RHAFGERADPAVARRAEDPADARTLLQLPHQRVLPPAGADHQHVSSRLFQKSKRKLHNRLPFPEMMNANDEGRIIAKINFTFCIYRALLIISSPATFLGS